ncbi:MAG: hypothetical protein VYE73_06925, partial [Acidobacteriota bacterium]|nr:hypothetical protein [Acidobacteriota bacterium]
MTRVALVATGLVAAFSAVPVQDVTAQEAAESLEFRSPNAAYEAGAFQQALEGFLGLQVERPADADLRMNLGSAQYRLGDFEAAAQSFAAAAANGDEAIRAEAYYNLGNTSYRRGQL